LAHVWKNSVREDWATCFVSLAKLSRLLCFVISEVESSSFAFKLHNALQEGMMFAL